MENLYKFDINDAIRFSHHVGIEARQKGNELTFKYCPYCKVGKSKDKNTFSINLETGQFNCLRASCGQSGNMITLARDFNFSISTEVDEYLRARQKPKKYGKFSRPTPTDPAIDYLGKRGISKEIIEKFNITTHKKQKNVLIFPFVDEENNLQMMKFRNMEFVKGESKGSKEWCDKNPYTILFGMQHCNFDNKTLVLTEGQIDSLSCAEAGIENAVSVPTGAKGFTWFPHCFDFMQRFDKLIVFGDYERDEISLLDEMVKRFRHGSVYHVKSEDYKGCKDANELLLAYGVEAVKTAVNNAVRVKNKYIKDLSYVQEKNLDEMEKIPTGIYLLDKCLKGFFFGQVVVLTGRRGAGKSTQLSQFVCHGLSAGYNVFCYSAELSDWQFKNWIDRQLAGPRHIESTGEDYKVTLPEKNWINEWYKNRLFMYDNEYLPEEDEVAEPLLNIIERAVLQYECRIITIDNLMTALEDDQTTDLYRQQSVFMKKLVRLARELNVLIFLVCHPKKTSNDNLLNDDVSGSSNITNLAQVVMSFNMKKNETDKYGDQEYIPYQRVIHVMKNRNSGRLTGKNGITVFYDDKSKRISSSEGFWDWSAGWEERNGQLGFEQVDNIEDEIPF